MSNKPNGAMGSESWAESFQPIPDRYRHLAPSDARKKIAEEERIAEEARIKRLVEERAREMALEAAKSQGVVPSAEVKVLEFTEEEFQNIINGIIACNDAGVLQLKNASKDNIVLSIKGTEVKLVKNG